MKIFSTISIFGFAVESVQLYKTETRQTKDSQTGEGYIDAVEYFGEDEAKALAKRLVKEDTKPASAGDVGIGKIAALGADPLSAKKALDAAVAKIVIAKMDEKQFPTKEMYDEVKFLYWGLEAVRSRILHHYVTTTGMLDAEEALALSKHITSFESRPVTNGDELLSKMADFGQPYRDAALEVNQLLYSWLIKASKHVSIPVDPANKIYEQPVPAKLGTYWIGLDGIRVNTIEDIEALCGEKRKAKFDLINEFVESQNAGDVELEDGWN